MRKTLDTFRTIAVRRLWQDLVYICQAIEWHGSYLLSPRQRRFYEAD